MNYTIDDNHLLQGDNVTHLLTSKNKVDFAPNYPDSLIVHYTEGSSATSSASYLQDSNVKASAHLVIGRHGEIFQIVPFDKIAWHAGKSNYGGRSGFNSFSIGIELDNAGILTKTGNVYQARFGKKYEASEAVQAIHRNETVPRFWHTYTEKQLALNEEITRLIIAKYPSIIEILGHEEISPDRKHDPGPAFPLDKFRRVVLGDDRDDLLAGGQTLPEQGLTVPSKLNIRSGAGIAYDKVAKPLASGHQVQILEEKDGWYRVKTEIEGWVSKGHINTRS